MTKRRGTREQGVVSREEIALVRKAVDWILEEYDANPDEAHEAGVGKRRVSALRDASDTMRDLETPRMKAVAVAALRGDVTAEAARYGYYRAVRMLHAMAPWIMVKAAEKMDDHQAPGSTRVILELLKGAGVLQPAEPIAARRRLAELDPEALREKDDEDLKAEVLGYTQ